MCAMIGVGNLGRALLNNFPFENTGFTVDASFDVSPDVIDTQINGIPVYSTDELESYIKRHAVDVVVLTIPQAVAQATANRLIDLGIRGFWNCDALRRRLGRRKKNGIWRITGVRYPFLASPRSWSGQYRRSRFGLKGWALAGCWILATM